MTTQPAGPATYEALLDANPSWAMSEGSLFFEAKGAVQESLRRITKRLNELGIPYAVAGGMALFNHGYRRFTEVVDILVTRAGLERIHRELDGLGWTRPFEASKNLRDVNSKVKIEFLTAGGYPGDGKPKAICFPDPAQACVDHDGIKFLSLKWLIELKLASGISGQGRRKDLGDVQELIRLLGLKQDYATQLHEMVRGTFNELWNEVQVPE